MTAPQSIWQGTFTMFGVEVRCHVLDDGRRIIEAESMTELLNAMASCNRVVDPKEIEGFAKWQKGIEQ